MASDPAFLFYPGDYLRDTQCLSEKAQVAYDRIMCEHMRNICITQDRLNFFIKRLSEDEQAEIYSVLIKIDGGFQITWVAESICKRRDYSESRRKNREGKQQKDMKTYDPHMEIENENTFTVSKKGKGVRGKTKIIDLIPNDWEPSIFLEAWADFVEMRKKKKAPLTDNAIKRLIGNLVALSGGNIDRALEIIHRSTDKAWTDFYPLDQKQISKTHQFDRP